MVSCRKNMENDPARGVYLWSSQCHWPIMTLWHLQPHELQMLYSLCVQHPKRHPTNFTPQTPLSSQLVKSYANFLRATCFWTPCSYLIARANARIHPRAATQMFLTLTLGLWRTVLSNLVNSTPVAKPVTWNEMDQISFTTKYRDRTLVLWNCLPIRYGDILFHGLSYRTSKSCVWSPSAAGTPSGAPWSIR